MLNDMEARVTYEGDRGRVFFSTEVADPPPPHTSFNDPANGVEVEAELDEVRDGTAFYREIGLLRP